MTQHPHHGPVRILGEKMVTNKYTQDDWTSHHPVFTEASIDSRGMVKVLKSKAYDPSRKR